MIFTGKGKTEYIKDLLLRRKLVDFKSLATTATFKAIELPTAVEKKYEVGHQS